MAKTQTVVAFSASAIMANGMYDEAEKNAISSIAKTFGVNEQEMFAAVDAEIDKQEAMPDEALNAYLTDMANKLNENEMIEVFQVCLVLVLSDGKLCKEEVAILLSFAAILNIDNVYATLMIAYIVNKETDLEIEITM